MYPKCTIGGVEEYAKRYIKTVQGRPYVSGGRMYVKDLYVHLPPPMTEKEITELSMAMYGIEIGFKMLSIDRNGFDCKGRWIIGSYKLEQSGEEIFNAPLVKEWGKALGNIYDSIYPFLNTVVGELVTGGIAGTYYGSFRRRCSTVSLVRLSLISRSNWEPSPKELAEVAGKIRDISEDEWVEYANPMYPQNMK